MSDIRVRRETGVVVRVIVGAADADNFILLAGIECGGRDACVAEIADVGAFAYFAGRLYKRGYQQVPAQVEDTDG